MILKSPKFSSGCLYVATGKKYLHEAIASAVRSRRYSNGYPICVSTDLIGEAQFSGAFDFVLKHPDPTFSYRDKIEPLIKPPFQQTLFLDTDAFLTCSLKDIFDYSSESDIAAVPAPVSHPPGWSDHLVPLLFGELNTGVIFLKKSRNQKLLIKSWLKLYDSLRLSHNQTWDQASFRSVLWDAISTKNLRFMSLPAECNLRTTKPWIAGRGQRVYVIHGRFPTEELNPFESYLNSDIDRFRTSFEWKSTYPDSEIYPKYDRSSPTI